MCQGRARVSIRVELVQCVRVRLVSVCQGRVRDSVRFNIRVRWVGLGCIRVQGRIKLQNSVGVRRRRNSISRNSTSPSNNPY